MTDVVTQALARWDMADAEWDFVAGRENLVYRVSGPRGDFALRIRRPGLRSEVELRSELIWLDAMERAGLSVPRPMRSASDAFLETIDRHMVDMVGWLAGRRLGNSQATLKLENAGAVFFSLGREMGRLHDACDAFTPPEGFERVHWDVDGLLGDSPLWGRFWENPTLDAETRNLLEDFRGQAARHLQDAAETLDYGLIHADVVRENVLIDADRIRLIDFDDGGYGFRLFDIATALLKNRTEPDYPKIRSSLIEGYRSQRHLDMSLLDLFMALRAVTYVGWIMPRMNEDGSPARNARFLDDARALCAAYLGSRNI
jgi:Ser/Thr protein kinase RdoA (MazF antagonist)